MRMLVLFSIIIFSIIGTPTQRTVFKGSTIDFMEISKQGMKTSIDHLDLSPNTQQAR